MGVSDLIHRNKMLSAVSVIIFISYFAIPGECRPTYRWFDYDHFPSESQAKPILDTGSGHVLGTVGPLRPYEPWVLDCNLLFFDKGAETGKRHPRCKEVDETNEKEYAKFLLHVQQWEEAYPDRSERWNARFPENKEKEKKKYEQLKTFADSHNLNIEIETEIGEETATSTQRTECKNNANCKPKDAKDDDDDEVQDQKEVEIPESESEEDVSQPKIIRY